MQLQFYFMFMLAILEITNGFVRNQRSLYTKQKYVRLSLGGKCVENASNNIPILDDCKGDIESASYQYWHVIRTSIYYAFKNKASGKCLARPEFTDRHIKTAEMIDCNSFNRIYWLSDNVHNSGYSFWWNVNEHKECMKTYNDNRNYKTITISKCTNLASERKIFQFLP